jgi:hypothetical protein
MAWGVPLGAGLDLVYPAIAKSELMQMREPMKSSGFFPERATLYPFANGTKTLILL